MEDLEGQVSLLQSAVADQAKEIQDLKDTVADMKDTMQGHAYDLGRLFNEVQKIKNKMWRLTQSMVDQITAWGIEMRMCF